MIGLSRVPPERLRAFLDGQQLRQRRAVDIGIQDADPQPQRRETQREIDRGGRFADPTLARGHRDDGLDPRHALNAIAAGSGTRAGRRRAWRRARRRRARLAFRGQRDERGLHARQRAHRLLGALAHGLPGLHLRRVDADRKEHLAVGRDHVRKRAGIGQRDALGALDALETREHLLFGHCHATRFLPRPSAHFRAAP